jgi:hypothetical protein
MAAAITTATTTSTGSVALDAVLASVRSKVESRTSRPWYHLIISTTLTIPTMLCFLCLIHHQLWCTVG